MDRPTPSIPQDVLAEIREALVYRANVAKTLADALRSSDKPLAHDQWLRARAARVAYYEAIKLIDEARSTGTIRDAALGGYDELLDALTTHPPTKLPRTRHVFPNHGADLRTYGVLFFGFHTEQAAANALIAGTYAVFLPSGELAPWGAFVDGSLLDGCVLCYGGREIELVRARG